MILGSMDLHVHTTMSDGDLSLEEVVALAESRGVAVGIADHLSTRNPDRFVATYEQMATYLDALDRAPVFVSGEFCWCDPLSIDLPQEVLDRFDYRIGSNHAFALPDGSMVSAWAKRLPKPFDGDPQRAMDLMIANLCDLVRTMPIQIVAHSTLTPPVFLAIDPDRETWWTEEREDRFVEAVVESGVAMEISNRYQLPHDRLLRKAREAGAKFSLGSDGHTAKQIARLDWAVETAQRAGIGDQDLFVPERRRK